MIKGKLKDEEHQKVLSLNERYNSLKKELADTVIIQEGLKIKKQTLIADTNIVSEELRQFQKEMFELYGEVKINMQTGEYY